MPMTTSSPPPAAPGRARSSALLAAIALLAALPFPSSAVGQVEVLRSGGDAASGASAAGATLRAVETVTPASGAHRYALVEPLTADEVAAVERRLAAEGHPPGDVDGRLDGAAREALRSFQREAGLRACGCVDVPTARALGLELRVVLTRVVSGEPAPAGSEGDAAASAASVEVVYPTTVAPPEATGRAGAERAGAGDHDVADVTARSGRGGAGGFTGGTVLPVPIPFPFLIGPDGSPLPPAGSPGSGAAPPTDGKRGVYRPAPFPRVPMPPIRPPRRPGP